MRRHTAAATTTTTTTTSVTSTTFPTDDLCKAAGWRIKRRHRDVRRHYAGSRPHNAKRGPHRVDRASSSAAVAAGGHAEAAVVGVVRTSGRGDVRRARGEVVQVVHAPAVDATERRGGRRETRREVKAARTQTQARAHHSLTRRGTGTGSRQGGSASVGSPTGSNDATHTCCGGC